MGLTQSQKLTHMGEGCLNTYKNYLEHILKWCGTLTKAKEYSSLKAF